MSQQQEHVFYGKVSRGKIVVDDTRVMNALIKSLEGKQVELCLTERSSRTLRQNRFFFRVVRMISERTGYTTREVKAILKKRFLSDEDGSCRSTASLDTREMAEFLDQAIQFAAELGVVIPDPAPRERAA